LGRDFSSTQDYSDETAALIDKEIKRIIDEAYAHAKAVLTEHADKLKFVAEFLLAHEIMDGDQFKAAMETDEPTIEQLEEIAAEKARRTREANEERARRNREEAERKKAEQEAAEAMAMSGFGLDEQPPVDEETPKDE
jgi:cell division protease FtsH